MWFGTNPFGFRQDRRGWPETGYLLVTTPGCRSAPTTPVGRIAAAEQEPEMLDVVFVGTVLALFALLALMARGVAKL